MTKYEELANAMGRYAAQAFQDVDESTDEVSIAMPEGSPVKSITFRRCAEQDGKLGGTDKVVNV